MCGIAGIITWDQRHQIDATLLTKMSDCIAHRGPDGEGVYLNHDDLITSYRPQCGLVHRRLAIIDLDERANQPFPSGSKKLWLTFNGEIYNFRALRKEISSELPAYQFRTESDTEVLLAAYLAWRERCVEKLIGMFAFAIWDETDGSLFIARDRMGQKPLFYAAIGDDGKAWNHEKAPMAFAFASELGCLRQVSWVDGAIYSSALMDYLRFGYVPAPATIYNGAWKLPPGTWMRISAAGVRMERYFDPNALTSEKVWTDTDAVTKTRDLVIRAVRSQLVSDVPLGCFLSGGIDSSIIAAAMKAALPKNQPVLTFSIGFDDPLYDETAHAAEVAGHLGTTHRQFTVGFDAADDLVKLAAVYGEPFADSSALPTYLLARETRKHVAVALSGDGGDELFGGYDRYKAMLLGESLHNLPSPLRWLAGAHLWQRLPGTHPKGKLTRIKRLLATLGHASADRYESYMRLFSESMIQALIPIQRPAEPILQFAELFNELRGTRDAVRSAMAVDRVTYLPDDLLTKLDRASMLHALEVRSPFMDQEIVQFSANLTTPQLLRGGGKRMLREAFAHALPPAVFARPKMGFAVPIGQWLRNDLAGMLRGLLFAEASFTRTHFSQEYVRKMVEDHHQEKTDHSQRLYALLMLELWWQSIK